MSRAAAPGEELLFFSGPARAYIPSPQDLWEKNGAPLQGKASPRSSHGLMGTYVGRESEGEEREDEMERPKVVYMLRSACRCDERKHFMRNTEPDTPSTQNIFSLLPLFYHPFNDNIVGILLQPSFV